MSPVYPSPSATSASAATIRLPKSPMNACVIQNGIYCIESVTIATGGSGYAVGDVIKIGDRLLVLEAMKMENNIASEKSGTVTAVHIKVGQQVLQNELMIELT